MLHQHGAKTVLNLGLAHDSLHLAGDLVQTLPARADFDELVYRRCSEVRALKRSGYIHPGNGAVNPGPAKGGLLAPNVQERPLKAFFDAARLLPLSVWKCSMEGGQCGSVPRSRRTLGERAGPSTQARPLKVGPLVLTLAVPAGRARMRQRSSWIRYSGLGIEFAAAVAGCTLVGYWIDRRYECRPWGILIGAMVGLIGGMYNLIRESLAAADETRRRSQADREDDS